MEVQQTIKQRWMDGLFDCKIIPYTAYIRQSKGIFSLFMSLSSVMEKLLNK